MDNPSEFDTIVEIVIYNFRIPLARMVDRSRRTFVATTYAGGLSVLAAGCSDDTDDIEEMEGDGFENDTGGDPSQSL